MRNHYRTLSGNMALKPGDLVVRVRRVSKGSLGRVIAREWVRVDRLAENYRAAVTPCDENGVPNGMRPYIVARRNLVPKDERA